jgi:hypothetical protein
VIAELTRNVTADDIPKIIGVFLVAVAWQVFRPRRGRR